jgi:hypothetical protein
MAIGLLQPSQQATMDLVAHSMSDWGPDWAQPFFLSNFSGLTVVYLSLNLKYFYTAKNYAYFYRCIIETV